MLLTRSFNSWPKPHSLLITVQFSRSSFACISLQKHKNKVQTLQSLTSTCGHQPIIKYQTTTTISSVLPSYADRLVSIWWRRKTKFGRPVRALLCFVWFFFNNHFKNSVQSKYKSVVVRIPVLTAVIVDDGKNNTYLIQMKLSDL